MSDSNREGLDIWGGIECSINRVNDNYFDQLDYSGHYIRENDLDIIAGLGIKKLRYPVLWEKHKPGDDSEIDFSFVRGRLERLRELGVEPIVGLVHHGSGPAYATIDSDNFAPQLAQYARKVAEAFPWVTDYTPINEPLTTSRFCGLYGHWYPHLKSDKSFIKLLVNECKATSMAMQEIRKVNPSARLIQTEDLGKIYSTPDLKYQADFENERRYLGFDLLLGKVRPGHYLWKYVVSLGVNQEDLEYLMEHPCPPDIIGFNYYLSSERYLDERIDEFPPHTIGGNGRQRYADVEAVRVKLDEETGVYPLLKEAWERFGIPMALTEVHMGCTREEQLRWLKEIFEKVTTLKTEGVDVRAITAWSLLGAYGWNQLITNPPGTYEPGIFDVSNGKPRPTALARLLKSLATDHSFHHPVLEGKGWWQRDMRVFYFSEKLSRKISSESKSSQPLLIVGKTGTLGKAFARLCELRGIHYKLLSRKELDISDAAQIEKLILKLQPWAIVNAAGFVRVDDAEAEAENCFLANTRGPANLAGLCSKYKVKLLTFSSDLVFDGKKSGHYIESDKVSPLNIYGQSKAEAEKLVLEYDPSALVVRTGAFFGPWDQYNFVHNVLSSLKNLNEFTAANDLIVSPTYVPDLVNTSLDLLLDDESGVWHLANHGETSWADLATEVGRRGGCNSDLVIPVSSSELGFIARRPEHSVLNSERGLLLPTLENALGRYFNEQELIAL